ncbi:hypothetical protein GIB67_001023 [Kingdonia uniflora]|uniref:Uncharacterized protein n=1 Tax=Kingdonia uniflora TaxID=39325 RepID=A0A7J7MG73_9MAGN|nr:hypothetical protein GIB67_001023 [Kingdonia uniflora]
MEEGEENWVVDMKTEEEMWVLDVKEKLSKVDTIMEAEHWTRHSINKIPPGVTNLNKKAYSPQSVSFGPYHKGEVHLMRMEDHKDRAFLHLLKRSNKPFENYVNEVNKVLPELMEAYESLDPKWELDQTKFLELMIVDGCFMLEILRTSTGISNDYATNDLIFSYHGMLNFMPDLKRDMLMLQNQLPMLLLEKLVYVETGKEKKQLEDFLNKTIVKFCSPSQRFRNIGPCLHVLDVYRKSLLQDPSKKSRDFMHKHSTKESTGDMIRSVMELHEAGIRFKVSKTRSLEDIKFRGGVLSLPIVVVDDTTETTFLNLMAYERFHFGVGREVTSYIFFMDNIIDSAKDISLLHSSGIIQNAIGSDKATATLFNSLSKDVTLDPNSHLDMVHKEVNDYCKNKCNEWRANLIHTYFRNPWTILSVVAAIFIIALTLAQTVYTIYPYYHPSGRR